LPTKLIDACAHGLHGREDRTDVATLGLGVKTSVSILFDELSERLPLFEDLIRPL